MYFEIWKNDKLVKRGTSTLNELSWSNELMYVPSLDLTLPIEYKEYVDGREEVKVFVNGKVFWGIVKGIELNKVDEIMQISLEHVVSEWRYRQISVNHAVADTEEHPKKLNVIYKGDQVEKNKGNDEGITANNFTIRVTDVTKMSDATMIAKAAAQAWQLSTGNPVSVLVDRSKLKAKEGTYKVTFYTDHGTKITVDCTVSASVTYGKLRKTKNSQETIQAKDFTITVDNVGDLDNDELKTIAKAQAWRTGQKKSTIDVMTKTIYVDYSNIQDEVGEYTVRFSTPLGTKVTIEVSVTEASEPKIPDPTIVDQISDIYNDDNFYYPGWNIDYQGDAGDTTIDYVYSRQNKLEALTKTMELTENLFWRVGFTNEKKIEIGEFGEIKPYVISKRESGHTNIRLTDEPTVTYNFDNVINVATVYGEKSDSGMSSLTLRDIYSNEEYQRDGFPVVILRGNVNNERDYSKYLVQYPKLAPNNEREFAVIDIESVRLEGGKVIEGTYAFTDLGSFDTDSKKISDARRIRAEKQAYAAAIRKLIQSRRSVDISVKTEEIPAEINVGDKVRLLYDNGIWKLEECSKYFKRVLTENDYFYITKIEYSIDSNEVETNTLTLSKNLKIERELTND